MPMVPFDGVINHILFFDHINGFDEVGDSPLYNMTYLVDNHHKERLVIEIQVCAFQTFHFFS